MSTVALALPAAVAPVTCTLLATPETTRRTPLASMRATSESAARTTQLGTMAGPPAPHVAEKPMLGGSATSGRKLVMVILPLVGVITTSLHEPPPSRPGNVSVPPWSIKSGPGSIPGGVST